MYVIAAIGHRPEAMGGIKRYRSCGYDRMKALAIAYFRALDCGCEMALLSGMARGWETAAAAAAVELSIPLWAAPPYTYRDAAWPKADRQRYRDLLAQASMLEDLQLKGKQIVRQEMFNHYVFHRGHRLMALWNGIEHPLCATAGMIQMTRLKAFERGIPIDNLWSSWLKYADIDCLS